MPHWCTRPPSDPPRNPEFSAWSPWPESLLARLSTLHMLKFVTSILNSWDSGKGNSLTACNTKYLLKMQHLLDTFSNPSKAGLNFKVSEVRLWSQDPRISCSKRPVWGSSPGRLGTHRALFQLAATWSNDPKKVILQAAPIESETTWNWKYDSWDQQRTTVCNLIRTVQESVYYLFLVNLQLLLHVFHDEVNYVILQTHNLEWLIRFWKTFKSSMSHWFRS